MSKARCEECKKEVDSFNLHYFQLGNKERRVCKECYINLDKNKEKLLEKHREKYQTVGVDDDKERKFQYVNVANPIKLGIYIGIGIFIVLPLLVFGVIILVAIFMAIFGYSLGSLLF